MEVFCGKLKDAFVQFSRNERWGTCVECPKLLDGTVYPEFCTNTKRYDHQLTLDSLVEYYEGKLK